MTTYYEVTLNGKLVHRYLKKEEAEAVKAFPGFENVVIETLTSEKPIAYTKDFYDPVDS
jgi:hypothetical protein